MSSLSTLCWEWNDCILWSTRWQHEIYQYRKCPYEWKMTTMAAPLFKLLLFPFPAIRVTRWVREKIAWNMVKPIFLSNLLHNFYRGQNNTNFRATSVIFKSLPKLNPRALGENRPVCSPRLQLTMFWLLVGFETLCRPSFLWQEKWNDAMKIAFFGVTVKMFFDSHRTQWTVNFQNPIECLFH
jgi:hypothetical protein